VGRGGATSTRAIQRLGKGRRGGHTYRQWLTADRAVPPRAPASSPFASTPPPPHPPPPHPPDVENLGVPEKTSNSAQPPPTHPTLSWHHPARRCWLLLRSPSACMIRCPILRFQKQERSREPALGAWWRVCQSFRRIPEIAAGEKQAPRGAVVAIEGCPLALVWGGRVLAGSGEV